MRKKRFTAGLLWILLAVCTLSACETGKVPANSDASHPQTVVSEPAAPEISQVTETPLKEEEQEESVLKITVGDYEFSAVFEDNMVQDALSVLLKDKTVMVIAHRMRTVANADKIVVLDDGKVSEMGTPAELMAKGGLYSHLVALQQGR